MTPPNILLVTSDQHRADALGCAGHPSVRTPHLDMLAAQGVRFRRAYADCPVCVPQRTTWVTGIQAHVYGMPSYSEQFRVDRPREAFLGSLLTRAGYQTHLVGKTHWHTDPTFRGGFESWTPFTELADEITRTTGRDGGVNYSGLGYNELAPATSPLPPQLYSTDWAVDRALRFLRQRDRTQPFCLWVSFTDPHPPNVIHEPYYSMYDAPDAEIPAPLDADWAADDRLPRQWRLKRGSLPRLRAAELRKARGVYYGKITNLDHQLGRLFGQLQADGLWDHTWVIYLSDHGELLGDYGMYAKSCFLDASARVPLIVRAPARADAAAGVVHDALVGLDDLLPTLGEIAGAPAPAGITGRSWLPLLRGETDGGRANFHGHIDESHLWHDGRYKYLYFVDDGRELIFDTAAATPEAEELSGDATLRERLRGELLAHLRAEGHAHATASGLLNRGLPRPTAAELARHEHCGWVATGVGQYPP